MKGRKDNTDDWKRQGQHKRPNITMDRCGLDKTKVSIQHRSYGQAFKNASLKLASSIISPGLAYMVVNFFRQSGPFF